MFVSFVLLMRRGKKDNDYRPKVRWRLVGKNYNIPEYFSDLLKYKQKHRSTWGEACSLTWPLTHHSQANLLLFKEEESLLSTSSIDLHFSELFPV